MVNSKEKDYPLVISAPEGTYFVGRKVLGHLENQHLHLPLGDESQLIALLQDDPCIRISSRSPQGPYFTSLRTPLETLAHPSLFNHHAYGIFPERLSLEDSLLPKTLSPQPRVTPSLLGFPEEVSSESF